MGTMLAIEWRPPRIFGEVPADYAGPLYYRSIRLSGVPEKKDIVSHISFERRKIDRVDVEQRSAAYVTLDDMRYSHPDMFAADGKLEAEWLEPLVAKRKASFPKRWKEQESFSHCSSWVRDAIEELEPGVHALIPVRLTGGGQDDETIYRLIYGNGGRGFVALSAQSNPTQNWVAGGKHLWQSTEFAYLTADRVKGKHIFWCEVAYVWSKELIDRIGDVFSEQVGLVPLGVMD